jgi:hypothetical protein
MSDREASLRRYEQVLEDPSPGHLEALVEAMAPEVVVVGPVGAGAGLDAVRAALAAPLRPGLLDGAAWSGIEEDGDGATVTVTFAEGKPLTGLVLHFMFDDGSRITRVEQQLLPPVAVPTMPLALTEEIKTAVAGALANGTPLVLAYVDAAGVPHISFRGSTQPYSDDQLGIWVRDASGGLLAAIGEHPHVALIYRDPATRASYQFTGRAHVEDDPVVRDAVYGAAPELERNLDARRLGAALVVDLDRVEGAGPGGRFRMER